MSRVFVSHSRRDADLAPWFDTVFARERLDAIRFEFEFEAHEENPTDKLVQLVQSSAALFVLLSPHVIGPTLHTANWVSAEVALARAFGKPIWVFERLDIPVEFPVPFVDHYVRLPLGTLESDEGTFRFVRYVVKSYSAARVPTEPWERSGHLACSNRSCQTVFQIHQDNHNIDRCPACCTHSEWDMAVMLCADCKGRGSVFTILPLWSPCESCGGSGALLVDMGSGSCPTCGGEGKTFVETERDSRRRLQVVCQDCRGTGFQRWKRVEP